MLRGRRVGASAAMYALLALVLPGLGAADDMVFFVTMNVGGVHWATVTNDTINASSITNLGGCAAPKAVALDEASCRVFAVCDAHIYSFSVMGAGGGLFRSTLSAGDIFFDAGARLLYWLDLSDRNFGRLNVDTWALETQDIPTGWTNLWWDIDVDITGTAPLLYHATKNGTGGNCLHRVVWGVYGSYSCMGALGGESPTALSLDGTKRWVYVISNIGLMRVDVETTWSVEILQPMSGVYPFGMTVRPDGRILFTDAYYGTLYSVTVTATASVSNASVSFATMGNLWSTNAWPRSPVFVEGRSAPQCVTTTTTTTAPPMADYVYYALMNSGDVCRSTLIDGAVRGQTCLNTCTTPRAIAVDEDLCRFFVACDNHLAAYSINDGSGGVFRPTVIAGDLVFLAESRLLYWLDLDKVVFRRLHVDTGALESQPIPTGWADVFWDFDVEPRPTGSLIYHTARSVSNQSCLTVVVWGVDGNATCNGALFSTPKALALQRPTGRVFVWSYVELVVVDTAGNWSVVSLMSLTGHYPFGVTVGAGSLYVTDAVYGVLWNYTLTPGTGSSRTHMGTIGALNSWPRSPVIQLNSTAPRCLVPTTTTTATTSTSTNTTSTTETTTSTWMNSTTSTRTSTSITSTTSTRTTSTWTSTTSTTNTTTSSTVTTSTSTIASSVQTSSALTSSTSAEAVASRNTSQPLTISTTTTRTTSTATTTRTTSTTSATSTTKATTVTVTTTTRGVWLALFIVRIRFTVPNAAAFVAGAGADPSPLAEAFARFFAGGVQVEVRIIAVILVALRRLQGGAGGATSVEAQLAVDGAASVPTVTRASVEAFVANDFAAELTQLLAAQSGGVYGSANQAATGAVLIELIDLRAGNTTSATSSTSTATTTTTTSSTGGVRLFPSGPEEAVDAAMGFVAFCVGVAVLGCCVLRKVWRCFRPPLSGSIRLWLSAWPQTAFFHVQPPKDEGGKQRIIWEVDLRAVGAALREAAEEVPERQASLPRRHTSFGGFQVEDGDVEVSQTLSRFLVGDTGPNWADPVPSEGDEEAPAAAHWADEAAAGDPALDAMADFVEEWLQEAEEDVVRVSGGKYLYPAYRNQEVQYYSVSHRRWLDATVAVKSRHRRHKLGGNSTKHPKPGLIYAAHVRTGGWKKQLRGDVPLAQLRLPLEADEPVDFNDGVTGWKPAFVCCRTSHAPMPAMYSVRVLEEDGGGSVLEGVGAHRLRRRYEDGEHIMIYRGPALGWEPAMVGQGDDFTESQTEVFMDAASMTSMSSWEGESVCSEQTMHSDNTGAGGDARPLPWVLVPVHAGRGAGCSRLVPSFLVRRDRTI